MLPDHNAHHLACKALSRITCRFCLLIYTDMCKCSITWQNAIALAREHIREHLRTPANTWHTREPLKTHPRTSAKIWKYAWWSSKTHEHARPREHIHDQLWTPVNTCYTREPPKTHSRTGANIRQHPCRSVKTCEHASTREYLPHARTTENTCKNPQ